MSAGDKRSTISLTMSAGIEPTGAADGAEPHMEDLVERGSWKNVLSPRRRWSLVSVWRMVSTLRTCSIFFREVVWKDNANVGRAIQTLAFYIKLKAAAPMFLNRANTAQPQWTYLILSSTVTQKYLLNWPKKLTFGFDYRLESSSGRTRP